MFEPTLMGIEPTQFWTFFIGLLPATLAFMFLFLLGLPLKELPFIKDIASDYKPPKYVLPFFALGSLLISSFCLGTVVFLTFGARSQIVTFSKIPSLYSGTRLFSFSN
jgi:hypothetical protein